MKYKEISVNTLVKMVEKFKALENESFFLFTSDINDIGTILLRGKVSKEKFCSQLRKAISALYEQLAEFEKKK